MLSPFCDYIRFEYDKTEEPLFLVQEVDCLRIISKNKHEILRSVPPTLYNVCMEGSESSGALLRRTFEQFTQRKSVMGAKGGIGDLTRDQIIEGIRECYTAALDELSGFIQEGLLHAVNYGQSFLSKEDQAMIATELPSISKRLRILNSLREARAALFLTNEEYSLLKDEVVIGRLIQRKYYQLAIKVETLSVLLPLVMSVLAYRA